MREIVIVIKDLYLEPEPTHPGHRADEVAAAPHGLEHIARFGGKSLLTEGWRAWTARWLGMPLLAGAAPASVAAAAVHVAHDRSVWLASPVHLLAGLTSLHVDRRSLLRLERDEAQALASSFAATFHGSGLELQPLDAGELLLCASGDTALPVTTEPARLLLKPLADTLPLGEGAAALRRLGTEIEMWLHGHPLNGQRRRRGSLPVSTLWIWGGGGPPISQGEATRQIEAHAFASDPYVRGLWRIAGGEAMAMPVDWAAVLGEDRARRALAVVEVADLLHAHDSWRLAEAVADIDRRLISPSLEALHRGELGRLSILANDRALTVGAADRWRLWRRRRPGLEGLA